MSIPIDHASHNLEVCKFLGSNSKYGDWVITTAHYSAIYYVTHKLFPELYTIGKTSKTFNNFDSYFNDYCKYHCRQFSPHSIREELVRDHIPSIQSEYGFLKSQCWTARYKDYKPNPQIVVECVKSLEIIKKFCENV
jgi:hypothetical protein